MTSSEHAIALEKKSRSRTSLPGSMAAKLGIRKGLSYREKNSLTIEQKFWQRVRRGDPTDCWDWKVTKNRNGYGVFTFAEDGATWKVFAHRAAFIFSNPGVMPIFVCHRCDRPICCNPHHLFNGTPQDNVADMMKKGRHRPATIPIGSRNWSSKLTEEQVLKIRIAYLGGSGQRAIAKIFGVTQTDIRCICSGDTWKHVAMPNGPRIRPQRTARGEKIRHSKLTDDLVRFSRARVSSGETITKIAREIGISVSVLSRAINGKSWRHVQ